MTKRRGALRARPDRAWWTVNSCRHAFLHRDSIAETSISSQNSQVYRILTRCLHNSLSMTGRGYGKRSRTILATHGQRPANATTGPPRLPRLPRPPVTGCRKAPPARNVARPGKASGRLPGRSVTRGDVVTEPPGPLCPPWPLIGVTGRPTAPCKRSRQPPAQSARPGARPHTPGAHASDRRCPTRPSATVNDGFMANLWQ